MKNAPAKNPAPGTDQAAPAIVLVVLALWAGTRLWFLPSPGQAPAPRPVCIATANVTSLALSNHPDHSPDLCTPRLDYLIGSPMDINAAQLEDLERLPGIGPGSARDIIEFRRGHGPFRAISEIGLVPGLSAQAQASLRQWAEIR